MKETDTFPFERARRISPKEVRMFRKAYENTFGEKPPKRGRPTKGVDKYQAVHIRIHPNALRWAKAEAKKRGIGYQTVINETLLSHAA